MPFRADAYSGNVYGSNSSPHWRASRRRASASRRISAWNSLMKASSSAVSLRRTARIGVHQRTQHDDPGREIRRLQTVRLRRRLLGIHRHQNRQFAGSENGSLRRTEEGLAISDLSDTRAPDKALELRQHHDFSNRLYSNVRVGVVRQHTSRRDLRIFFGRLRFRMTRTSNQGQKYHYACNCTSHIALPHNASRTLDTHDKRAQAFVSGLKNPTYSGLRVT